jgi:hypothetical protein
MPTQTVARMQWFRIVLIASFVAAWFSWAAPGRGAPTDFHTILWWSLPLAFLWVSMVGVSAYRFGRKALWMLFGAPLALYWPVWLVLNGIPACYWRRNCV